MMNLKGECKETGGHLSPGPMSGDSYNQRLFSGNWRSSLHLSRFYWLKEKLREFKLQPVRMIELGCHDGKTIEFLEDQPKEYLGLDANWEGGLDLGRVKWKDAPHLRFQHCIKPSDIPLPTVPYDVGICMETLEHIPPDLVLPYLKKLSELIEGFLFITVPIERGVAFFLKHGLKKVLRMRDDKFEDGEFMNCVMGRLDKVKRLEHKGFDDRLFVEQVRQYFEVISISGVFPRLPVLSMNLTLGIVAKTKTLR
jgi:hypothetical protein